MARTKPAERGMGYKQVPGITASTAGPYIPLAQAVGKCQWLRPDMPVLVDNLVPHVAQDGLKFKPAVLSSVAAALNQRILRGGPKKVSSVRDKIAELLARYQVVDELKNLSGVDYSEALGCNIHGPEAERVWDELVRAKPARAPYKNVGWDLYDLVARLHPPKAKGSHVYRPQSGQQGQVDPTADLADASQDDDAAVAPDSAPSSPRRGSSPDTDFNLYGPDDDDTPPPPPRGGGAGAAAVPVPTPAAARAATAAPDAARTPIALKRRASSTATPASSKRARNGAVEAAEIMRESVRDFGKVLADSSNALADAIRPQVAASPVRRKRAMDLLEEKDAGWLSVQQGILLGEMFESSIKADMYLEWNARGSPRRRAWVAHTLGLP